jgi:hypothetical protein
MHKEYRHKIFSTFLRSNGIEPELIDLLQGRMPNSVSEMHNGRPAFEKEKEKISSFISVLHKDNVVL